jgi:hypothetical protein
MVNSLMSDSPIRLRPRKWLLLCLLTL